MNDLQPIDSAHPLILVPLDGSQLAEAVLPYVARIASALAAQVLLLHVLETDAPDEVHGESHLVEADPANGYLAEVSDRLRTAGVGEVQAHVHDNRERDVAKAIVDHAQEYDARLIVLANHGSGGWREFFFGSIAQQVIRHGQRSVVLIPVRERLDVGTPLMSARPLAPIALASSITDGADPAFADVAMLARAYGVGVHLIAVVETLGSMSARDRAIASLVPSASREVLAIQEESVRARLAERIEAFAQQGVSADGVVLRGDPAEAIVAEATRIGAGLLALATHGHSELARLWTSSVGSRVLATYGRPLLLVPDPGPA
ncbi:MAG: universal stress protein [Thermomicrobiales bacterium]